MYCGTKEGGDGAQFWFFQIVPSKWAQCHYFSFTNDRTKGWDGNVWTWVHQSAKVEKNTTEILSPTEFLVESSSPCTSLDGLRLEIPSVYHRSRYEKALSGLLMCQWNGGLYSLPTPPEVLPLTVRWPLTRGGSLLSAGRIAPVTTFDRVQWMLLWVITKTAMQTSYWIFRCYNGAIKG